MYKFLQFCILMMFVSTVLLVPTVLGSQTLTSRPQLHIVIVNSYGINHYGTMPQVDGFLSEVKKLNNNYDLRIHEFYMEAKTKNILPDQRQRAASYIIEKIRNQSPRPSYLYFTDDVAFEYVGVPMLKKGYDGTPVKILVSGLNKHVKDYVDEGVISNQSLQNMIAVEENIYLDKLMPILSKAHFKASKWYILWDESETSYYMLIDYEEELVRLKVRTEDIVDRKITSINDLKKFVESTQNEQPGVYIVTLQALKNEKGQIVSKDGFVWVFTGRNTKHLEITGNSLYTQIGYAASCGPDFETMGAMIGRHLVELVGNSSFKGIVLNSPNNVSINIKRLRELSLNSIIDENFNTIKQAYQGY